MEAIKRNIRTINLSDLETLFVEHGEKPYRARQVHDWLWNKSARHFDQMTNLSVQTREWLEATFVINQIRVDHVSESTDGTVKNAVVLHDGLIVESVMIPTEKRITACVSSQVGCSLGCTFCATARLKKQRNLSVDEIFDQVVAIREQAGTMLDRPLTNIVFMGMGEPLLNYDNVMKAIELITSQQGLNMAARRITVSTVGIVRMIYKISDAKPKFNLAVSLHSADEAVRQSIMPITQANPLKELSKSLQYWYQMTGSKVTFEYIVWKGINDSIKDAEKLLKFCKSIPCKVNLIEYNPVDGDDFAQADDSALNMYIDLLEQHNITTRVRKSRGKDIDAACGQLANKVN